jgi:hypothetical protein
LAMAGSSKDTVSEYKVCAAMCSRLAHFYAAVYE